jgi:hypothetical protein
MCVYIAYTEHLVEKLRDFEMYSFIARLSARLTTMHEY